MIGLSEYINEAVAKRSTGKYSSIWKKRISESSTWSDFTMALDAMGAKEINIDLSVIGEPSNRNIITRMVDWYSNRTEKRPVFSFVMAKKYKPRIFILTRDGIGYSIALKVDGDGIDTIARYEYDWNLKTLICTHVWYRNRGDINRILSDIKDILENETK